MKKKRSVTRVIYRKPKVTKAKSVNPKCRNCGGEMVVRTYMTRATENNDESREIVWYCPSCDIAWENVL